MEFRMGHLAFRTHDMKATLQFYVEKLGFHHVFSIPDDEGHPLIEYVMLPDGRFIEFFYVDAEASLEDKGYMHLCLEVDDCEKAVEELAGKGIAIRVPVKVGKDLNKQAWIRDPDGRDLELMEIVPEGNQAVARRENHW